MPTAADVKRPQGPGVTRLAATTARAYRPESPSPSAKLTMNTRFALEYISNAGALRYYYPDFVMRLSDDTCLIVETKGLEDLDVALKDRRARRWCQDSTRLAGASGRTRRCHRSSSTPLTATASRGCEGS